MTTVAVTGAAGFIGQSLLEHLENDPQIERIIGIDIVDLPLRSSKVEAHTCDIRDPTLAQICSGADTLVHLAFVENPLRDRARMRSLNVGGFRSVLNVMETANIRKFVYLSSAVAYGTQDHSDAPFIESHPLRPTPGFLFAEHKAETEALLALWQDSHPDTSVTILRPAPAVGPNSNNFMTRAFESPRFVIAKGMSPSFQVLHELDLAHALAHFSTHDLPGTFNLGADGALTPDQLQEVLDRKIISLNPDLILAAADLADIAGLVSGPCGELLFLMDPCIVSNDKAKETGWQPRFGNHDAIQDTLRSHTDFISFGPIRANRQTLRRNTRRVALAFGLAAVAMAGASKTCRCYSFTDT